MKFRFCGDADCPDWILAEINSLSRLSSVKLKLLAQVVVQGVINPPINIERAEKLFAESKLEGDIDLKACIACLAHIIQSAVRFNCESNALQRELQQLGLPREHSAAIKKVTEESRPSLSEKLRNNSLAVNRVLSISAHYDPTTKCVSVNLEINSELKNVIISPFMLEDLIKDLRHVRKTMSELNEHQSVFL